MRLAKVLGQFNFSDKTNLFLDVLLHKALFKRKRYMLQAYKIINKNIKHYEVVGNNVANLICWEDGFGIAKSWLRRKSSDYHVFEQVVNNKEYLTFVTFVTSYIAKINVKYILDCGANVGLASIYFKKNFPNAKLIAVEPDLNNYNQLKENFSVNEFVDTYPLRAGISDREQTLQIDRNFRDKSDWSFSAKPIDNSHASYDSVQGLTIHNIMEQFNIPELDILKIDIEGAEKFLFNDPLKMKPILEKTKFLSIEIHEEVCPEALITKTLDLCGFGYFYSGESVLAYNKNLLKHL